MVVFLEFQKSLVVMLIKDDTHELHLYKYSRGRVKILCYKHKVNFLAIQETKMETLDLGVVCSFWENTSFSHVFSPSQGASGVILVIWNPNDFLKKGLLFLSGLKQVRLFVCCLV